jgi:beta-lactamase regulating signal transducer with metallopeptidase domain
VIISSMILWSLAWTILGSAILAVTHGVTRYMRNAAARHLAWLVAFSSVWLFPAYAAMSVVAWENDAVPCSTAPPISTTRLAVICVVLIGWAGGAIFTIARAMMARRMVNQWYVRSSDYQEALKRRHLPELPALFPKNTEVRVSLHAELMVPITWGVRKPVVLLPTQASEWESSRLTAVLLHEVAHIRRFDNLTQLFALLTCAFHWFNPVFWHGSRIMEAESEIAADDFALLRGVKPSNYAEVLLSLDAQLSHSTAHSVFAQTAMIKPFTLEHRLLTIINPNAARGPIRLLSLVPAVAILLGAILTITILTPRVNASLHPKVPASPSCLPARS